MKNAEKEVFFDGKFGRVVKSVLILYNRVYFNGSRVKIPR